MAVLRLRLDFAQVIIERFLGGFLQQRVQRGVNPQAAFPDLVFRKHSRQFPNHRIHHIVFLNRQTSLGVEDNWRLPRGLRLRLRNDLQLHKPVQHRIPLSERSGEIGHRRKTGGAADDSRKHGRFSQRKVQSVFVEIRLTGGLDPKHARPEVNPVHVVLKNFVLGKILLDPDGHKRFENFPMQGFAAKRERVAG